MKILVWGTGKVAERLMNTAKSTLDVSCFVESSKSKNIFYEKPVFNEDELDLSEWDYILVAVSLAEDIRYTLYRKGISMKKVIFLTETWLPVRLENGLLYLELDKASSDPIENSLLILPDGIFSTSKKVFDVLKVNSPESFWSKVTDYDTSRDISPIAVGQKKFLDEYFVPQLKQNDTVLDIACASGEYGRYISSKVAHIEGVDVSEFMIKRAKELALSWGFSNLFYRSGNVMEMKTNERKYNHVMMLGLLTCIEDDDAAEMVVRNINTLCPVGGYIVARDTLSLYSGYDMFWISEWWGKPCSAIYRDLRKYENFYEENGFSICAETYLSAYAHHPVEHGSHAYVLKKERGI